jgi:hypothetical protein
VLDGGEDDSDVDDTDEDGEEIEVTGGNAVLDGVTLEGESEVGVAPSDEVQLADKPRTRQTNTAPTGLVHSNLKAYSLQICDAPCAFQAAG